MVSGFSGCFQEPVTGKEQEVLRGPGAPDYVIFVFPEVVVLHKCLLVRCACVHVYACTLTQRSL